jgi:hypothetical protein
MLYATGHAFHEGALHPQIGFLLTGWSGIRTIIPVSVHTIGTTTLKKIKKNGEKMIAGTLCRSLQK